MLTLSRERASIEKTVEAFNEWTDLNTERLSLIEMEQASDADLEIKEMSREEQSIIQVKQDELEKQITLMLLPRDPNDDRNVMLEVRAGTGGDEASIFAGELVAAYKKYSDAEGWRVIPISDTAGEMGGYKTCIVQITGDYVYSKLKYEVSMLSISIHSLMCVR